MPNISDTYLLTHKWNNPPYIFGTLHYNFSDIVVQYLFLDENLKSVNQQYISMLRLQGCLGWPGSILMTMANFFRF